MQLNILKERRSGVNLEGGSYFNPGTDRQPELMPFWGGSRDSDRLRGRQLYVSNFYTKNFHKIHNKTVRMWGRAAGDNLKSGNDFFFWEGSQEQGYSKRGSSS